MADNALKKRNALSDLGQGVSRGFWADGLGGPVDMMTTLANLGIAGGGYAGHKLGLLSQPPELIQNPTGGSEWIAQKMRSAGLLNDNPGSTADSYGRVAGGLLAPLTAARAPQIANALQQAPEAIARAASPKYVAMGGGVTGRQGGAVNFEGPQSKALRIAQANAAKPIADGGLGLHPKNTPMERARAMGFTEDAYHGTPDDRLARSLQFKDEMLGKSTQVSDAKMGHFTTSSGDAASEYIWRDGSTDGGNVLPLLLAGDRANVNIPGEWAPGAYDNILFQAKRGKYPGVNIKGATTLGKPGDYQVTFDPKNIRSRFAAFDPFNRNSANILAGLGAGGLGLSMLLESEQER